MKAHTPEYLKLAVRLAGIDINEALLDKIINLFALVEIKGGKANVKDIEEMKARWKADKK